MGNLPLLAGRLFEFEGIGQIDGREVPDTLATSLHRLDANGCRQVCLAGARTPDVAGTDAREYQYLLVADIQEAAVRQGIWPTTANLQNRSKVDVADGEDSTVPKKRSEKWTKAEQRTLLDESKMPGVTQTKLAEKYGVSRQRIAALLEKAQAEFEAPAKASAFPTVSPGKRLVRGRNF
ncbi:protein of unknown function [Burkholderia multivorans]